MIDWLLSLPPWWLPISITPGLLLYVGLRQARYDCGRQGCSQRRNPYHEHR